VVLGAERILSNRSGRFGWDGVPPSSVLVFGADGLPVSEPSVSDVTENGLALKEVRIPGDQLVVVVR
jgi:hypothetical protein